MQRAAVLVGVSKSGDLPTLQAVAEGVQCMADWCEGQGIRGDRLRIITDQGGGKVSAAMVRDAIDVFVQQTNLDQLIVYFSGHGIYNRGDLWLLSDAPRFANEAVNVEGSIQLARYCGIDHVVFFADACRVAADSIQATGVTGTEVFPNDPVDGKERAVDVFFACARGKPALEVKDPTVAASQYSALYTEVLKKCLEGDPQSVVEASDDEPDFGFVRPWPLCDELQRAVPLRLAKKLGKQTTANQIPTARISSRSAWLSRLSRPGIKAFVPAETLAGDAREHGIERITGANILVETWLSKTSPWRANSDVRWNSKIATGVSVIGAELSSVYAGARSVSMNGGAAEISGIDAPEMALVACSHGRGTLVPILPGMVTELVFESGELARVVHQPGSQLPEKEIARWEHLGGTRRRINDAAEAGVFLLSPKNQDFIRDLLKKEGLMDPSVALHAAYALHAAGARSFIPALSEKLVSSLGFDPMDLRMLAQDYLGKINPADVGNWPFLSQAWPLLRAFRIELPQRLRAIESYLAPSVWTSFNSEGLHLLRRLI